jgi:hypothetical protein
MKPGLVYNGLEVASSFKGGNLTLPSLENGEYYVQAVQADDGFQYIIENGVRSLAIATLAKITVYNSVISDIEQITLDHIRGSWYTGPFAVTRFSSNQVRINPGAVNNIRPAGVSWNGTIATISTNSHIVICRIAGGGHQLVVLSHDDYQNFTGYIVEEIAEVIVSNGEIAEIAQFCQGNITDEVFGYLGIRPIGANQIEIHNGLTYQQYYVDSSQGGSLFVVWRDGLIEFKPTLSGNIMSNYSNRNYGISEEYGPQLIFEAFCIGSIKFSSGRIMRVEQYYKGENFDEWRFYPDNWIALENGKVVINELWADVGQEFPLVFPRTEFPIDGSVSIIATITYEGEGVYTPRLTTGQNSGGVRTYSFPVANAYKDENGYVRVSIIQKTPMEYIYGRVL